MKRLIMIYFLFHLVFIFASQPVYASNEDIKSDATITFMPFEGESGGTGTPSTYDPQAPVKPGGGQLPNLGQMLTSFILLLTGVACLIVFLGIISLRKIYRTQI